jgi:hypothetical protein
MQPLSALAKYLAELRFYAATCRYINLHVDMFGHYKYGLPPKPKHPEELNKTFLQWIEHHKLHAMIPFFIYSQAAQVLSSRQPLPFHSRFVGSAWHTRYAHEAVAIVTGHKN